MGSAPTPNVFRFRVSGVCIRVNMSDHEMGDTPPTDNHNRRWPGGPLASALGAALKCNAVGFFLNQ